VHLSLWCELKDQESFIYKNSEDTFSPSFLSLVLRLKKGGAAQIDRKVSGLRARAMGTVCTSR